MSKILDILEQLEWKMDKAIAEGTYVLSLEKSTRLCEDAPCCGCCE